MKRSKCVLAKVIVMTGLLLCSHAFTNELKAQEEQPMNYNQLRYLEKNDLHDYGIPQNIIQKIESLNPMQMIGFHIVYKPELNNVDGLPVQQIELSFSNDCLVGFVKQPLKSTFKESKNMATVPLFIIPVEWVCTTSAEHPQQHTALISNMDVVSKYEGCKGWHQKSKEKYIKEVGLLSAK